MKYTITEGDYSKMGVIKTQENVVFTFEGEKEDDCRVVLINRTTHHKSVIEVPAEFCLGSLRSIAVSNPDMEKFVYYYEINGQKKIDPYATKIIGREKWNDQARIQNDYEIFCACQLNDFEWNGDIAPEIPKQDMIMYKANVRGFSKGVSKLGKKAGTFRAITDKIEYFRNLGFTSLQLMPVYEFEEMVIPPKVTVPDYIKWEVKDEDSIVPLKEEHRENKVNFWGYGTGNYFAVKSSYASDHKNASYEFKELIRELHKNSMECIMEIYFERGTNHNLILDVLRFWVREYRVDGFHLLGDEIPITAIVQDVMLSRTKILYSDFNEYSVPQKGEYKTLFLDKDEYLYPTRKLLNHMNGGMRAFLDQQRKQGEKLGYINYIASNNGFTLADLFMYNDKHNEANGEGNLDGNQWNFSNNYGCEGPTRKRFVSEIRKLKWRNAMMMLFLAQGVPMVWSGDEIGNSQEGNNNAYCQDNKIGWINWKNDKLAIERQMFLKKLIEFRKKHSIIASKMPYHFNDYGAFGYPDLSYHAQNAWASDADLDRLCIGLMYCGDYAQDNSCNDDVYIGYNFFSRKNMLALPALKKNKKWFLVADSSKKNEQFLEHILELKDQHIMIMEPQAICILVGRE